MFKEMDLSEAVPRHTVAVTFRFEIRGRTADPPPLALLADNAQGEDPVRLAGDSGQVTIRLRTPQKLYYSLGDPQQLHVNLWIVDYRVLTKYSC